MSYVNSINSTSKIISKTISSSNVTASTGINAVALNENKVVICFYYNNIPNAVVCNITESKISIGTFVALRTGANNTTKLNISIAKLTENSFCVGYSFYNSKSSMGYYSIYCVYCSVSGTTITTNTESLIANNATDTMLNPCIKLITLSSSKIFALFQSRTSSSGYTYGRIISVSSTNLSLGSVVQIYQGSGSGWKKIDAVALNENLVIVLYMAGSTTLRGVACTISSNTFKVGTYKIIADDSNINNHFSIARIDANRAFILYFTGTQLNGVTGTISSSGTLTLNTITNLATSVTSSSFTTDVTKLDDTTISVIYDTDYIYHQLLCSIENDILAIKKDLKLTSSNSVYPISVSSTTLNENKVFTVYVLGGSLNGIVSSDLFEKLIKTTTSSTEQINGIAITDGQAGEMVSIKKPDEMLEITLNATITAGGNSISWNNVKLSHRRHLDGDNRVYTASKTISINNVTYTIKFYITYVENSGWRIGFECPPGMYFKESTDKYTNIYWLSSITKPVVRSGTYYTGANNTGTQISVTANITDVTI